MEELESLVALARAAHVPLERRHEALGELVKRFQDMVFGCAYAVLEDPQLAEDTAQEAFTTVYQQLGQL